MFTQGCLLRNVKNIKISLIVQLTKFGYSPMYLKTENNLGGNNLVCEDQTWHCTDSDNKPDCIDCGENVGLFLAIAALRDDTDQYQWFTDDCESVVERVDTDLPSKYMQLEGHKMSVDELVKFFSK